MMLIEIASQTVFPHILIKNFVLHSVEFQFTLTLVNIGFFKMDPLKVTRLLSTSTKSHKDIQIKDFYYISC